MKATYFYSEKQKARIGLFSLRHSNFAPNGKEYTQCDTREGLHSCNWDDHIVVQVLEGLPLDDVAFEATGKRFAKTTK